MAKFYMELYTYLEPHMAIAILDSSANPTTMYHKLNRSVPETHPKMAKIC